MVQCSQSLLDATFAALADPVRRALLERLARGNSSVTELAAPFAISLPGVAKHLRVLERAGLVITEKSGRVRSCRLEARPMRDAAAWIAHYRRFWEDQLDALARYLEESERESLGAAAHADTPLHQPTCIENSAPRRGKRKGEKANG